MAKTVKREWSRTPQLPVPPKYEMPFIYEAYVPDEIAKIDPVASASVAKLIHEADESVRELNGRTPALMGLEALSRHLLRQESVASSRIEGLVMSNRRLAKAAIADDDQHRDTSATSILANINAMEFAINSIAGLPALTAENVIDIHRVLMQETQDDRIAGVVRASQNWIGGNNFNPQGAAFIPPPEFELDRLMLDLAAFLNRSDISPTLQAAIAHAQFETIHPFADGNGRVGRCLIHVVFRRCGLAPNFVPPVSLILATAADAYVDGLTSYRTGDAESWYLEFASAVIRASRAAHRLAGKIDDLNRDWLKRAGDPRAGSAARRLIAMLPAKPIFKASDASEMTCASSSATNRAINKLADAGVLKQITIGRRNRAWEAVGLLDLADKFERSLATPDGGDRKPVRPVPYSR